jgi:hypothetical protein
LVYLYPRGKKLECFRVLFRSVRAFGDVPPILRVFVPLFHRLSFVQSLGSLGAIPNFEENSELERISLAIFAYTLPNFEENSELERISLAKNMRDSGHE